MECPVCLGAYDSQDYRPLFLPCGHSICASCVSDLAAGKPAFLCPSCRKSVPAEEASSLPTNFSLLATSQTSQKVVPEERKADSSASLCVSHPGKKVKFHCSGCRQAFCSNCVVKHTGAGHQIQELGQAIDRKLDEMLLEIANTDAALVGMNSDLEEFAKVNSELEGFRDSVAAVFEKAMEKLRKEQEEVRNFVSLAIESNQKSLERARETIKGKIATFSEAKELLRAARHSQTDLSEKQGSCSRAESLLKSLWGAQGNSLQPLECELSKAALKGEFVPERFIDLQISLVSFGTKEVEEKKETEAKKEVAKVEPHPTPQKSTVSIAREAPKGKKRADVCWWYMGDNNSWAPYTPAQSRQIEHAYQAREPIADLGRYQVDFQSMLQSNKKTGRSRKVGREIS